MEKAVSFRSDGLRLYGIVGLPEPGPAERGVVLIHGWSGYRIGPNRILVQAARAFNQAGVATLRFDLRGRGDSEGESAQTDLDAMIRDACAAAVFLHDETGVGQPALLGLCSGANVAIGAATEMYGINELILWSVFTFQPQKTRADSMRRTGHYALDYLRKLGRGETWRKLFSGRVNFPMVRRVLFGRRAPQGERNLKDSQRDIMADFARWRGRALFIHGSKDVEAHSARQVFQQFCRERALPAEFLLIEGANHNFHSAAWKADVIGRSIAWFLAGRAPQEAAA